MSITFYNNNGVPVAYSDDGCHIFLFTGEPVAYLYNISVYSYLGNHLGFFEDGWIYDNSGARVFFTENASGGPAKPAKRARPSKGSKRSKPSKRSKRSRPSKPAKRQSWSDLSSQLFFS